MPNRDWWDDVPVGNTPPSTSASSPKSGEGDWWMPKSADSAPESDVDDYHRTRSRVDELAADIEEERRKRRKYDEELEQCRREDAERRRELQRLSQEAWQRIFSLLNEQELLMRRMQERERTAERCLPDLSRSRGRGR